MAQLFPPVVDFYAKFLALGVVLLLLGGGYALTSSIGRRTERTSA